MIKMYFNGVLVLIVILGSNLYASIPDTDEILDILNKFDKIYKENGFSISGTSTEYRTKGEIPGHPEQITRPWKMTFQGEKGVISYELTDPIEGIHYVEPQAGIYGHDPNGNFIVPVFTRRDVYTDSTTSGLYSEYTNYIIGANNSILSTGIAPRIHNSQSGLNGVGRYVIEIMWSIGRGFSSYIEEITETGELEDGKLRVFARGHRSDTEKGQWELVIDPKTAWIVRNAKFSPDFMPQIIATEISNSGIKWNGSLAMPVKTSMNYMGPITSKSGSSDMVFSTITEGFNEVLFNQVKKSFQPPFKEHTTIRIDTEKGRPILLDPSSAKRISTNLLESTLDTDNSITNKALPVEIVTYNDKTMDNNNLSQQSLLKETVAQSNAKKPLFYLPRWVAYTMLIVGLSGVIGLAALEHRKRRDNQI